MNPRKPLWTVLTFTLACAIPYLASSMERFRFLRVEQIDRDFASAWTGDPLRKMFPAKPVPAPVVRAAAKTPVAASKAAPKITIPKYSGEIADPEPVSIAGGTEYLALFHLALQATRAGAKTYDPHAITRVVHIGDSPLCGDLISSEARARLQQTYGDGGPGWHLPARPWEFYMHDRMSLKASGWKIYTQLLQSFGNKGDYGLAGVAFSGNTPRASSTFSGWRKNPPAFSRVEVHYEARPDGGSFEVLVDGASQGEVSTKDDERHVDLRSFSMEDGPHELTVRAKGNGEVTLYGVAMERDRPGVVYDSLGSLGASVHWLTLPNREAFVESVRLRHPHLVIIGLGTNESGYGNLTEQKYVADYSKVIEMIRQAVPNVSILIMAPMDRGTRGKDGEVVTMPAIPQLVEWQRKAAEENHVAFFNTFQAMGGSGTMARWYNGKPRLVSGDYTHPNLTGANRLGDWLVNALLEGVN